MKAARTIRAGADWLAECRRILLNQSELTGRDRVLFACQAFFDATLDYEQWPDEIRSEAALLLARILQEGTVNRTLAAMTEEQLEETAQRLAELIEMGQSRTGRLHQPIRNLQPV
jgi:hypothetical protein